MTALWDIQEDHPERRRQRFLLSDAITVTSSSQQERHLLFAKSYDLLDATVILSIEFYPNDVSFPFICITSERSQSDYSYLLNTLERLKRSSLKKVKEKGKSKGRVDVELFLLSIQYLKERIEQSEQLLHSLLPSRESKVLAMASVNHLTTSSAPSSPLRHYDVVMQNKLNRATTALTHQTFESHVVANAAKTFLSELQKNLTYSPTINIFLVEQSIYQYVLTSIFRHNPSPHPPPPPTDHHTYSGSSFSFHRHQVTHFLLTCGVWVLQQTLLASELCHRCEIMKEEMSVLREKFFCYDNYLTNEITTSDFRLLLQDLGAEYEEEELRLIIRSLDSDDI
eukprot:gene14477-16026_t